MKQKTLQTLDRSGTHSKVQDNDWQAQFTMRTSFAKTERQKIPTQKVRARRKTDSSKIVICLLPNGRIFERIFQCLKIFLITFSSDYVPKLLGENWRWSRSLSWLQGLSCHLYLIPTDGHFWIKFKNCLKDEQECIIRYKNLRRSREFLHLIMTRLRVFWAASKSPILINLVLH